jgi:hypothetical protein
MTNFRKKLIRIKEIFMYISQNFINKCHFKRTKLFHTIYRVRNSRRIRFFQWQIRMEPQNPFPRAVKWKWMHEGEELHRCIQTPIINVLLKIGGVRLWCYLGFEQTWLIQCWSKRHEKCKKCHISKKYHLCTQNSTYQIR